MSRFLQKPISPHLSPNARGSDVALAVSYFLNPLHWPLWQHGPQLARLEKRFSADFGGATAVAVDSGRSALRLIIEALELEGGDEVVTQAFTCIVVPNAIRAAGGAPRYLDIDDSYNLDPVLLETALQQPGHRIRAVIVQHTFGVPADIIRIQKICRQHQVTLIEDCAHALGAQVGDTAVGNFGDAAMFSFGRDKIISSVSGGMVIAHQPDLRAALQKRAVTLPLPRRRWTAQRLLHPIVFTIAKRLYYTASLGKILIALGRRFHWLPDVLTPAERSGTPPPLVQRLPNALAHWANQQYDLLHMSNSHRRTLARHYADTVTLPTQSVFPGSQPAYLRYSVEVRNQAELLKAGRDHGILLGDWYTDVVIPCDSSHRAIGYTDGSCPRAERLATRVVNLPTNPLTNLAEAKRVSTFVKQFSS